MKSWQFEVGDESLRSRDCRGIIVINVDIAEPMTMISQVLLDLYAPHLLQTVILFKCSSTIKKTIWLSLGYYI